MAASPPPARLFLVLAASGAALAACAPPGPYPSLGVRPAEAAYKAGDEERQPMPRADNPAVAAEIARLVAEARAGDSEFSRALPEAQAAVSGAGSAGSDSWAAAQQQLSRLEGERIRTTRALADLDAYALAQSNSGLLSQADIEQLRSAVAAVQALANGQAERLDRLQASLRRR